MAAPPAAAAAATPADPSPFVESGARYEYMAQV